MSFAKIRSDGNKAIKSSKIEIYTIIDGGHLLNVEGKLRTGDIESGNLAVL